MSTPRGTPSMSTSMMNIPATQNTAPVIKFRCLYTHDMRRKAKRWQDGYLRYHTFNKRIMVYDTVGNYIGDHHWRQDEEIQDGDELELDNGILIEVGESVERTETDVSSLHGKKKSHNHNGRSPLRPGETPMSSVSTPSRFSQQMRSLNDLLGIKKSSTSTQRSDASLEERHPNPTRYTEEVPDRPAKRPRMVADRQVSSHRQRAVIDLTESTPDPIRPTPTGEAIRRTEDLDRKSHRDKSSREKSRDNPKHKGSYDEFPSAPEQQIPNPPSKSAAVPDPPMNKIRLSTGKQRKKMLYQPGLINTTPTTTAAAATTSIATSSDPDPKRPIPIPRPRPTPSILPQAQPKPQHQPPLPPHHATRNIKTHAIDSDSDSEDLTMTTTNPNPRTTHAHTNTHTHIPPPNPHPQSKQQQPLQAPPKPIPIPMPMPIPTLKSKSSLRKSYSDPTALATPRTLASRRPENPDHDAEAEQGPWTREARYLFDFWPPGRERVV
ncbi:hypothetical protein BO70DRAFT_381710 [Aspergillus heteromorphus CBS 117.55]|uniref:5'-3' DNA helicase ZGRF1-like N-terminal domain-containing protein n=1 Tax=Aspergillus heteromorphus CBS 117.55 TaxID=1448321 RepID=A0A317VEX3_9EURO|nr:uncharacterized protein BO70DRAFT_381710 [Aspergillus heteromorphus CBS 117.55]PWY72923.1 hypothetical protein BO70DRAFT_381710 [Aspergillus heteromorphus CBS 117.55]